MGYSDNLEALRQEFEMGPKEGDSQLIHNRAGGQENRRGQANKKVWARLRSIETKLRYASEPRYTLPVAEGGISSEEYNAGGLGTPDKELCYLGRYRHKDENLAAQFKASGRGCKSQRRAG